MDTSRFEKLLRDEKTKLGAEQKENAKEDEFDNADHFFPEEEADQVEAHDIELSMDRTIGNSLEDIDAALERIEKGTYGTCEACGQAIDEARLEANPAARTHTQC
ncbi:hypothetical protein A2Z10_00655 [Candidatus Azambacteria bacterium RBG_16_47_10]|uniref:Zinc finger DksA/TraR C4-type domain-containing protein n=1 Tax=Candidatus Azambacteria bacterium RBG_16_47_10 TaxID=1797292 RepID=A0A1F5AZ73_9BACT|nr:MAG: hypothetical protein A2Z10_00655 [Candidatus Azambacteria bacterium RBG_16_47_10]